MDSTDTNAACWRCDRQGDLNAETGLCSECHDRFGSIEAALNDRDIDVGMAVERERAVAWYSRETERVAAVVTAVRDALGDETVVVGVERDVERHGTHTVAVELQVEGEAFYID